MPYHMPDKEKEPELYAWFQKQMEKNGPGVVTKAGSTHKNPCVEFFGPDPGQHICRDCDLLFSVSMSSKRYYKCRLRKLTGGPGSDHKLKWPACARFTPKKI